MRTLTFAQVDLTAARELQVLFQKDYDNLKELRDTHPEGSDEYERLYGKANASYVAVITIVLALTEKPANSDEVFRKVIEFIQGELASKENAVIDEELLLFTEGYLNGLKLVLEKTTRERQYIV